MAVCSLESRKIPYAVNDDGDLYMECGGRIHAAYPYTQSTPLLPISAPRIQPDPIKEEWRRDRIDPSRREMDNYYFNNDHYLAEKLRRVKRSAENRNVLFIEKRRSRRQKKELSFKEFKERNNLFPVEYYGKENFFNGSCIKVTGSQIYYTGNDGILNTGDLRSNSESRNPPILTEQFSATDDRLNFSRIYSLNLLDRGDGSCITCARYKNGFAYFLKNQESLKHSTSVPCAVGGIGQCFLGTTQSCMLDINSNLSILDLESNKINQRMYIDSGVEPYSWGVLAQGPGNNKLSIGGRKTFGILDIRSGSVELLKELDEKIYLRGLEFNSNHLYSCSDESVGVWDLRNLRQSLEYPLEFQSCSLVQGIRVQKHQNRSWVLTSTNTGDFSLAVLDFTHDTCENVSAVDSKVRIQCTRSKVPDLCGRPKVLKGWRDTVIDARLGPGVWLESSVEKRAGIEFRGLDIQSIRGEPWIRLFSVNAIGDLFSSTLNLEDTEDELGERSEKGGEWNYGEYLENWGNQVFKSSKLKMNYARKVYYGNKVEEEMEEKKKGEKSKKSKKAKKFKEIKESEKIENTEDTKINLRRDLAQYCMRPVLRKSKTTYGSLNICPDYTGPKIRASLPSLRRKINYSSFEDGISSNIIKIMMPHGLKIHQDEGENLDEENEHENDPPMEEDPNYALKSYLAELGVSEDNENILNFSRF